MRRINERFGIAQHQHLQPADAVLVAGAGVQTPADPAEAVLPCEAAGTTAGLDGGVQGTAKPS